MLGSPVVWDRLLILDGAGGMRFEFTGFDIGGENIIIWST